MEGIAKPKRKPEDDGIDNPPAKVADTKRASTVPPYCIALELIALLLHREAGGDNNSTTTVCFSAPNSTLYITSQKASIKEFPAFREFTADSSQIDSLQSKDEVPIGMATAKTLMTNRFGGTKKSKDAGILDRLRAYAEKLKANQANPSALFDDLDLTEQSGKKEQKSNSSRRIIAEGFTENMKKLNPDFLIDLVGTKTTAGKIAAVKVVSDLDILAKVNQKALSGLHGESRIMRFLYIKHYKTDDTKTQDYLKTLKLYFGSSQGTCPECCQFLDGMGAAHGPMRQTKGSSAEANQSQLWTHPFTGMGRSSDPVVKGTIQLLASAENVAGPRTKK